MYIFAVEITHLCFFESMKLTYIAAGVCCMALLASCGGSRGGSDKDAVVPPDTTAVVEAATGNDLDPDLPDIPVFLTDRQEIAGYAVVHFWDKMDFTDTAKLDNDEIMEKKFANYFSAFPYATAGDIATGFDMLMGKAEINLHATDRVMDIVEKFLTSPNSAMRDEELYYTFLQRASKSSRLDTARKQRVESQIADILKNRQGTPATDFAIIDRDGRRTTLYKEAAERQARLVIFYDPDCTHCHEIIEGLKQMPELNSAIASGALKVMAVYPDGDMDMWEKGKEEIPAAWFNGYSPDGEVTENELYVFPAMPVIYVLAPDNTVLLKDVSLPLLADWLSK